MPEIIFNGPEGRLEGRYHKSQDPGAPGYQRLYGGKHRPGPGHR